jgi:hypothetical protein
MVVIGVTAVHPIAIITTAAHLAIRTTVGIIRPGTPVRTIHIRGITRGIIPGLSLQLLVLQRLFVRQRAGVRVRRVNGCAGAAAPG